MNIRKLKGLLGRAVEEKKLFHAYLFEDRDKERSHQTAGEFAKNILCADGGIAGPCGSCQPCMSAAEGINQDLMVISNEGAILVDDISRAVKHLSGRSYTGGYRVLVIENADMMNASAQNKLLKTLEEPPERSVIIMTAVSADQLLMTVLSRCTRYNLSETPGLESLGKEDHGEAGELLTAILGRKPFYVLDEIISSGDKSSKEALELTEQLMLAAREAMLTGRAGGDEAGAVIRAASVAYNDIKAGLKVSYVLRTMLLTLS